MLKRLLWLLGLTALGMLAGAASAQAPYVTLTGTLQGSNGTPASNYAINFKPSQIFFIAGTGVIVPSSSSCATSVDGTVVLVRNPLVGSVVSQLFSGTLPPATYYVETSFYTSTGTETLVGPETSQQIVSTGGIVVAPPVSGIPSTAVGMRVYIGTSSGSETLQGHTTGGASFTQNTTLASGANPPTSNNTVCQQVANDAGWPTGTGYTVSMTDTNGNTLPGYPMQWQLMGGGTTVNLSMGLPYYQGTVYFPSPLLASPINHATQSISGPLNFTGYNILNVTRIGLGTALPAWPVDVENGAINASGGYIYNGGIGVTTGWCLIAGSDAFHTYTPAACPSPSPVTLFYQTVQANGTPLTQQPVLNFDATLSAANGSGKSTVGLPNVGTPGTYANPASITIDAQGRIPSVTPSSAINRVCSGTPGAAGYSCYIVLADGTTFEWGISNAITPGGGNLSAATAISFPHTFTAVPVVTLTADSCPNASDCSASAQSNINVNQVPGSLTTSGISAYSGTSAVVGGGGASIVSTVHIHWSAFGF